MGIAEAALIIGAVSAAGTAGATIYGNAERNKATKRAQDATQKAADVQSRQLKERAAVEQDNAARQAAQVRSRIRALQAGAGFNQFDAYDPLQTQANFDAEFNRQTLDRNVSNELERVQSGLQVDLAQLSANRVNPLLSAFTGITQGLSTGLSIANAGVQLGDSPVFKGGTAASKGATP